MCCRVRYIIFNRVLLIFLLDPKRQFNLVCFTFLQSIFSLLYLVFLLYFHLLSFKHTHNHMDRARARLILQSGLHLVFLVTPPFSTSVEPTWTGYERVVDTLYREHPGIEETATYLGKLLAYSKSILHNISYDYSSSNCILFCHS
jgi:hypothetical protein